MICLNLELLQIFIEKIHTNLKIIVLFFIVEKSFNFYNNIDV